MIMNELIIIGGGPAGMMAAIAAAEQKAKVTLLEGNEKTGKKLYITGKGRCNLTNVCGWDDFFGNIPRNSRFMMSSFSVMDNHALMEFFEGLGVPLKVERGERVFPVSEKASDITKALNRRMEQLGISVMLGEKCKSIAPDLTISTQNRQFAACGVILATGGCTYPVTGSTGDGYRFARELGHTIMPPQASLVPLEIKEEWPKTLSGLTMKNVELTATVGKKNVFSQRGEMLFTHFGISGPLVLSLSAHLPQDPAAVKLSLDTKPALSPEQLDARLLRDFEAAGRKRISTVLPGLLPASMGNVLLTLTGIDPMLPVHQVTRVQREALVSTLKAFPMTIARTRPMEEAVITRGGVDVKQVNPKTMASKIVPGLYFAGEILDVDAYTGGFNLQIAFSTGYAAGVAAAKGEQ